MSTTPYLDSLIAAGLIDADFAFINGTLYDTISGRVITPGAASRLQRNGLVTDLTTDNTSSGTVLQNVTEGTVMCLCTPRAITAGVPAESLCFASDMATVGAADGFILGTRGTLGTIRFAASTVAGLNVTAEGAAGSFVLGKKAWFSGTFKNNDAVKVFLNGVESGSASYAGKTKSNGEILYIGNRASVSRRIAGLYARLVSIKAALTGAQQITLQAELDSVIYDWNTGGIIINPANDAVVYDYKGGFGIIESTANEGGSTGAPIGNTEWVCGDATGRFKVVYGTGPNGERGKGIKCITGGDIVRNSVSAGGTWTYNWYDDSATAWKTQADAIHAVNTFTLDTDDILWIADEAGPRTYDIRHTP